MAFGFPSSVLLTTGLVLLGLCVFVYVAKLFIMPRVSAWYLNGYTKQLNCVMRRDKEEVFKIVQEYLYISKRDEKILDVMSGPGANLDFIPQNVKLVCLDKNPHYRGYIEQKVKKEGISASVKFVEGCPEEMPFENGTFGVIICMMGLCVVHDIEKSLKEIKRVLKRGGRFIFLEHLPVEEEGHSLIQKMTHKLLARVLYGCHGSRDSRFYIENAGFDVLDLQVVSHEENPPWAKLLIMGSAIKGFSD